MAGRIVLITDLDGTLLGDAAALDRFAAWCAARHPQPTLVYASGRFFASVLASLREFALPRPAAIIGGVGTEIHTYPDGRLLSDWTRSMPRSFDARRVRAVLAGDPDLEAQPGEFQSELKVSFFLHDAAPRRLAAMQETLRLAGIDADLVYSSRRDLDVLPRGVNKGTAARFLMARWEAEPLHVIVSGDSGNDVSLFQQGFRGIVVGNAHEDLKTLKAPPVYQARAPFAEGVLEGLRYWTRESEPDEPDR